MAVGGSKYSLSVRLQLTDHLESDVELARASLEKILGKVRVDVTEDGQVWAEMQTGRTLLESDLYLTVVAGTGFDINFTDRITVPLPVSRRVRKAGPRS